MALRPVYRRLGRTRRRAVVIVYVIVSLSILLGFCSLAVDLGRVQVVKTELRRAADAAARAGTANLSSGTQAVYNAASAMAAANTADGTSVSITPASDVQFLIWTSAANYTVAASATTPGVNAVRVYCRRTTARGNAVPLFLAQILGQKTCDVTASSVTVISLQSSTQYISAHSNPWLSGEPTGTLASDPDPGYTTPGANSQHPWQYDVAGPVGGTAPSGEPYESPVQLGITVVPGAIITVTNVSGAAQQHPVSTPSYNADGSNGGTYNIYDDQAANGAAEHGISDAFMPINATNAVFLSNSTPDSIATPPPVLDFTNQSARDYTSIAPKLQQVFYVGNGQTSGGVQQQIIVPAGATRMFLGTMDGHEWSNNVGGFTATVTQTQISIVQ